MKKILSVVAVLLALSLVLIPVPTADAAGTAPAGETASVQFTFENIAGLNGDFTFDNSALIEGKVQYTSAGTVEGDVTNNKAFFSAANNGNVTIIVSFKISANAKVGDQCKITFEYETFDAKGSTLGTGTKTETVTVVAPTEPTTKPTEPTTQPTVPTQPTTQPTQPTQPSTQPTQPSTQPTQPGTLPTTQPTVPTEPTTQPTVPTQPTTQPTVPTEPVTPTTKPTQPTQPSTQPTQPTEPSAPELNYQPLQDAIDAVESFLTAETLDDKLVNLLEKLDAAKALMNNAQTQEEIDAAAEALLAALTELQDYLKGLIGKTEIVEVDNGCEDSMHYVWPILFFVSLALNAIFVGVLIYLLRRMKKEIDDTPVVDYDIGDDA